MRAQGRPLVEPGLPLSAIFLGSFLSSLSLTARPLHGPLEGQSTNFDESLELKHGSRRALPLRQRQASRRLAASEPLKHDPWKVLVTRTAGLPEALKAW